MAILTIALILSISGKLMLHLHLNWKKDKLKHFIPGFIGLAYFFFYLEEVDKKNKLKKTVCNALYLTSIILIILISILNKSPTTREILLKP